MLSRTIALVSVIAAFTSGTGGHQAEKPQSAETVWKFAAGG